MSYLKYLKSIKDDNFLEKTTLVCKNCYVDITEKYFRLNTANYKVHSGEIYKLTTKSLAQRRPQSSNGRVEINNQITFQKYPELKMDEVADIHRENVVRQIAQSHKGSNSRSPGLKSDAEDKEISRPGFAKIDTIDEYDDVFNVPNINTIKPAYAKSVMKAFDMSCYQIFDGLETSYSPSKLSPSKKRR